MAKRTTNAEIILNEARTRVAGAQSAVELAERSLEVANAALAAHSEALNALEKALVSKPRKKSVASPPAAPEPTADKEAKCGICGNVKDHPDHDRGYIKSHDFEPPKSVARAPRKSRKKPEGTASIPSSGMVTEGAGDAALAASGGSSGD
jgi:hypothetical protein